MSRKIACITGATAGFGKAIAELFAREGYDLLITGRREERLRSLAEDLGKAGSRVLPLAFDVRNRAETEAAFENLPNEWKRIHVLVNNAGLALGREHIASGDPDDWDAMIDTNVKGLLYVTRACIPHMRHGEGADIVNIGSIAGKEVYPGGNVYCASKFAVDALSKALRQELLETGIRVAQISPGAAETEFSKVRYKGDDDKASQVYKGYVPLSASDVAETVLFAVSRPSNVCINDLVIVPAAQANSFLIKRDEA